MKSVSQLLSFLVSLRLRLPSTNCRYLPLHELANDFQGLGLNFFLRPSPSGLPDRMHTVLEVAHHIKRIAGSRFVCLLCSLHRTSSLSGTTCVRAFCTLWRGTTNPSRNLNRSTIHCLAMCTRENLISTFRTIRWQFLAWTTERVLVRWWFRGVSAIERQQVLLLMKQLEFDILVAH